MQIVYKRLTESELDIFIKMRISQLIEEYTVVNLMKNEKFINLYGRKK